MNAFSKDYKPQIDWSGARKSSVISANATRNVNDKRKQGVNVGTIHELTAGRPLSQLPQHFVIKGAP